MRGILHTLALLAVGALFTAGLASGQVLPKDELKKLITSASTRADHERIAKHYEAKAEQLEVESKEYLEEAAEYRGNPPGHEQKHPLSGRTAAHCELFARKFADAAKEARRLAADHMEMAKTAK